MAKLGILIVLAIAGFVLQFSSAEFKIDYEANTFLLDGKPFRYISGSIHYFRVPREYWRDRLRKFRAAGLNAISTYVAWNEHERVPGQYNFTGGLNITEFIQIAQEEDLYVVLRPGPYICAEYDMGGFPYWLMQLHPDIFLRHSDPNYMMHVEKWMGVLFNELEPLWNGNGGPIIMAQVENEYGNYRYCDKSYSKWLRDLFLQYIGDKAVLFTNDNARLNALNCGKIEGVLATLDFSVGWNVTEAFGNLRQVQPDGPLVNSEFYPGWLTHWGEKMAHVETSDIVRSLRAQLDLGANVNFYMMHGGTNFGFTAGASSAATYVAHIQSYDYDAPISEAGDLTPKYYEIQKVIAEYLPLPNISVATAEKGDYGELTLKATASFLAPRIRSSLGRTTQKDYPTNFEAVGQNFGYMLYETTFPQSSQKKLLIERFSDYAHVYVNERVVGELSREFGTNSLIIEETDQGDKLSIVVENLGRINSGFYNNDTKGILTNVTLGGQILQSWEQTSFELDNVNAVEECFEESRKGMKAEDCNNRNGFIFYVSKFQINQSEGKEVVLDTYLNMTDLNKGVVFVNGFNIGRYWPTRGPQYTLYIPGVHLKSYPDENVIVVMEEEIVADEIKLSFTTEAIFVR